jgi:hypothetical protein
MKIGANQILQTQLYTSDFQTIWNAVCLVTPAHTHQIYSTTASAERRSAESLQLPPVPSSLYVKRCAKDKHVSKI